MFEKRSGEVAVLGKAEEGVLCVDTEKVRCSTEIVNERTYADRYYSQQGFCSQRRPFEMQ